jgi:hypothetical protein
MVYWHRMIIPGHICTTYLPTFTLYFLPFSCNDLSLFSNVYLSSSLLKGLRHDIMNEVGLLDMGVKLGLSH